jgi:hypothetical protein
MSEAATCNLAAPIPIVLVPDNSGPWKLHFTQNFPMQLEFPTDEGRHLLQWEKIYLPLILNLPARVAVFNVRD